MSVFAAQSASSAIETLDGLEMAVKKTKTRLSAPEQLAKLYDSLERNAEYQTIAVKKLQETAAAYSSDPQRLIAQLLQDIVYAERFINSEDGGFTSTRLIFNVGNREIDWVVGSYSGDPAGIGHPREIRRENVRALKSICDKRVVPADSDDHSIQSWKAFDQLMRACANVLGFAVVSLSSRDGLARHLRNHAKDPKAILPEAIESRFSLRPEGLMFVGDYDSKLPKPRFALSFDERRLLDVEDRYRKKREFWAAKQPKLGPNQVQVMKTLLQQMQNQGR